MASPLVSSLSQATEEDVEALFRELDSGGVGNMTLVAFKNKLTSLKVRSAIHDRTAAQGC